MSDADKRGDQIASREEALANSGADTLAEMFTLDSIEQLRVIADPLRIRILDTLVARALTVTQLGKQLGESPAKLHYHVRELERVGMVRQVATRDKEGILEKYYRAVARSYSTPPNLLQSVPRDEFINAASTIISRLAQGFLRALTTAAEDTSKPPELITFAESSLWLKPEELRSLMDQIQALLDQYSAPREIEGEREMTLMMMGYDAQSGAEHTEETAPVNPVRSIAPVDPVAPAQTHKSDFNSAQPRPRRVVVIGALTYKRSELEQVIARGEQLDINVSGYCSFADDVTPDLIDRAIIRLRYRGVLSATPAAREALRHKEVVKEAE